MARVLSCLPLFIALLLTSGAGAVLAQPRSQTRVVTGAVTDVETGAPLGGAQVDVKAMQTLRTVARENGTFSLSLPAQDVVLVVRRIGYQMTEVAVAASATAVAVAMRTDPLKLDEVVVTGHASGISRRNLAHSVASVSAEELTRVSAASIENALQAKIPGAQIQQNTGAPGGGNRIRIRGTSSILGNSEPLYVIDGVILSNITIPSGTNSVTFAGGGSVGNIQDASANRIVDLNPDDIETIEVLKGSAVAAMYGSRASAGVIMITTKRGRVGRQRVSLRTRVGTARLAHKMGTRRFLTLESAKAAFDPNNIFGDAFWASAYDPSTSFDYEALLFGERPLNYENALSLSGGSERTRYFVSTLMQREGGIVKNTFADKKSVRINLDQNFGSRVTVSLGAQALRNSTDRGLFGNDNAGGNTIYNNIARLPSFLDVRQRADGSYPTLDRFASANPFQTVDLFQNRELTWRSITTGRLTAEILRGTRQQLRFVANGGVDVFNQRNNVFAPPELHFEPDDTEPGTAIASHGQNTVYNTNLNLVHVLQAATWISVTTQLGTQYDVASGDLTRAIGYDLQGGLALPAAARVRDVESSRYAEHDFGIFTQSEALLWDRLLVTAGMRADRSSNNGNAAKFYVFPKFATSYRLSDLRPGVVDDLKLRLAYGETGNRPAYGERFTTLFMVNIGGLAGLALSPRRGAADIRPERQRELEAGFDASLFGNRAQLELTGFRRHISNLIIERSVAPTTGFSREVYNAASLRVDGIEAAINAFPLQAPGSGGLTWKTRLSFALNRDRVTDLPVPPFILGSSVEAGAVRISEGRSASQLIGNDTVSVAGVCPRDAVDPTACANAPVGAVFPVYMGRGNPDFLAGIGNDLRWRGLGVYALLERQKGGMLRSNTWGQFDLHQTSLDYDAPSSNDTMTLGRYRRYLSSRVTRVYYQDASYWKLRELSLTYDLPRSAATKFLQGAEIARLSLSGRNLKTWTRYRGTDPDYDNFGVLPRGVQRNRELGPYPPSRSYWLGLELTF